MTHIYMIIKEMWSINDKIWDIISDPIYTDNDMVWEKVSQLNHDLRMSKISDLRQGLSIYENSLIKLKSQKALYNAFTPEQKAIAFKTDYDQRIKDCEANIFRMGYLINNLTDRPYYSDIDVGHRYAVTRIELVDVNSL